MYSCFSFDMLVVPLDYWEWYSDLYVWFWKCACSCLVSVAVVIIVGW